MADEKEVIVTSGDGGGGGGAMALIAVVLVVVLLVGLYLVFGRGLMDNTKDIKADIKIDTPATNR